MTAPGRASPDACGSPANGSAPTYIKLGQIISSGEGLFPDELVTEFKRCRDRVPAEDFATVRAIVEADLGAPIEDTFETFEREPLAAASIAQVHRGVLRRGPDGGPVEVVVKVQRPGIAAVVERDIAILSWLAPLLVGRIPVAALANPPALVEVFTRTIVEELDFRLEADNMIDVAASFAAVGQTGYVVPRPHPDHVTRRVLVMERLDGFAFDDLDGMSAAGIDLHRVVRTGMIGFMEGCMLHGIFHGDLHGGNLLVLGDGRTALLDYGITARLSEQSRLAFLRLLVAGTTGNVEGQLAAIRDLGALPPDTDLRQVIDDLGLEAPTIDPTTLDPDELVAELNDMVKGLLGYGARMPKELMLFAKNLVFVDAAIATLTPDVDLLAEIAHLVQHFAVAHGARIAADVGIDPDTYRMDLTSVRAGFGLSDDTDTLSHRDLQQRRELIRQRLQRRDRPRGRALFDRIRRLVGPATALVLAGAVVAGCASSGDRAPIADATPTTAIDAATVAPTATSTPPPATLTPTPPAATPTDEPDDNAIDVATALERNPTGVLVVEGYVVITDGVAQLCSALAESFPPQCGPPAAPLEALELADLGELRTEGATSWTEEPVAIPVILVDGRLEAVGVG